MKIFFGSLILLTLFSSCNSLKLASNQKNISNLAIDYNLGEKVNPIYKSLVDSTFDVVIAKFNAENHSLTFHKKAIDEEKGLSFDFTKGKFVSKSGITAGYIVSGIGLIAAPVIVLTATSGEWVAVFYYWPSDKFDFSASLSPSLAANPDKKVNNTVAAGALFSSKNKRLKRISKKLKQRVYKILLRVDRQAKKAN